MLWCSLHFLSVYLSVLYRGRDLISLASATVYLRWFAFPGPGHFMTKWLPTSFFHSWFGRPAFPFAVSANDCGWFILLACSDSIGHIFCDFDPRRMPALLTGTLQLRVAADWHHPAFNANTAQNEGNPVRNDNKQDMNLQT